MRFGDDLLLVNRKICKKEKEDGGIDPYIYVSRGAGRVIVKFDVPE